MGAGNTSDSNHCGGCGPDLEATVETIYCHGPDKLTYECHPKTSRDHTCPDPGDSSPCSVLASMSTKDSSLALTISGPRSMSTTHSALTLPGTCKVAHNGSCPDARSSVPTTTGHVTLVPPPVTSSTAPPVGGSHPDSPFSCGSALVNPDLSLRH